MSRLTDAQQAAIGTLDRNLLVKAGAGAGKTRVLVERYIHILESGAADIDGIAAITFTRKAAREMKERIRARIDERLAGAAEPGEWERWRGAANRLDAADICTIHSLCSRILRENPAEAGVDPDFGLMEEIDETDLLDEVWQETFARAIRTGASWLRHLLAVYSPAQLRQDFRSLFDAALDGGLNGAELARELWPAPAGSPDAARLQLKQACQELFALVPASGKRTASQERLAALKEEWPALEGRIDAAAEDPSLLEDMEAAFRNLRGGEDLRQALNRRRAASEAFRGAMLDRTVERLLPDLCEWFDRSASLLRQAKQTRLLLTYDDLEQGTERLLLGDPRICGRYVRRFRFLMVDECQDINERQRRIIYLLAGGQPDTLVRSNLFAVGDAKQSIYRFRGADPRVFQRVQEDVVASGGQVIEFLQNFRSHQLLVTAFNDFFAGLMPAPVCEEDAGGADIVEYRGLQGKEPAAEEAGPARLDLWVLDGEAVAGGDARAQEAAMIARRIRGLTSDPSASVRYGQIAVLLRAFTHVSAYEAAFAQAGIPYYVAGGRGFTGRQEIADVLGLLRFLDNPENGAALFGTLRSPFFQLSDEALLRLKRAGGSGGLRAGLAAAPSLEGLTEADRAAARQAQDCLERWLARRGFLTPEQLIREALDETGFAELQLTQFMGVRRFANLRKLLDMAAAFMAAEGGGIAAFLDYVERRADSEGEAEIDSEAGDTVRIMTIHKSKGLEFPVVIVPDLQRRFNSRAGLSVFVRGAGMGLKVPDSRGRLQESARFRRIARLDNAMERAELKRVLYVAMTRAERRIILSAVADNPKTGKDLRNASGWLDWARHLFGLEGAPRDWPPETCLGGTCLHITVDREPAATGPGPVSAPVPAALEKDTLSASAGSAPLSGAALPPAAADRIRSVAPGPARPLIVSPAYFAEFADCPRRYFYARLLRLPEPPSFASPAPPRQASAPAAVPGPSATDPAAAGSPVPDIEPRQLGLAFHRFMELLPDRDSWRESLARAVNETLPPEQRPAAEAVMPAWAAAYADSGLYTELRGLAEDRREWGFQYRLLPPQDPLPAVWLSGQADRVLFYPDGSLGILDYKTDRLTEDSAPQKAARYRLQLAGYALAARAVFGRPVRDIRLYLVRTGAAVPLAADPAALAAAEEELRTLAAFLRSHREEADYPCRPFHCAACPYAAVCLRE